jgi:Rad3-related DNA helicase
MPMRANRSASYRFLVEHAISNDLQPKPIATRELKKRPISLRVSLIEKIEEVTEKYGIASANMCFTYLVNAAIEDRLQEKENTQEAVTQRKEEIAQGGFFKSTRHEQVLFFNNLSYGLENNSVVVAEASTGVGKGRAMMAAAVQQIREKKGPVVVAAPTLAVMTALHTEFFLLENNQVSTKGIRLSIRPGRTEFVDDARLKSFIEDIPYLKEQDLPPDDEVKALQTWVESGGKLIRHSALARAMQDAGITPRWLMDDFRTICPNFDHAPYQLNKAENKDGSESEAILGEYLAQVAEEADIILCTHAMLCLAQKNQWNPQVLKQPHVIIIDEAHLFEQTMAMHNTKILSLSSLRGSLSGFVRENKCKKTSVPQKVLNAVNSLLVLTRDQIYPKNSNVQQVRLDVPTDNYEHKLFAKVERDVLSLASKKMIGSRSLNHVKDIDEFRQTLSVLRRSIEKQSSDPLRVVYSPVKNWPSLMGGTSKLYIPMKALWNAAEGGVALVSATMYTPATTGGSTCDYMRSVLSLPMERIFAPHPITASYLYEIPTLHYPAEDKRKALCPPNTKNSNGDFEKNEDNWISALASELKAGPVESAVGGTLILCTSYVQIEKLAQALIDREVEIWRIIQSKSKEKFDTTKLKFIEAAQNNTKPILLALGAAWTGVDFLDSRYPQNPEQDNLLTDLVIIRSPIGLNRSFAMMERIDRQGTHPIGSEALLTLKQGLGRLIRRDGVKDRHIWMMDGRLWLNWPGMEQFTAAARKMLAAYKKSKTF